MRLQLSVISGRHDEITFIKAVAIISVVLLHSVSRDLLLKTLAPFHIWQAVPMFFLVAGINRTLGVSKDAVFSLQAEYSIKKISRPLKKVLIPFSLIYLIELPLAIHFGRSDPSSIGEYIWLYIQGGFGPGSYFIPAFLQFLLFFPLLYWTVKQYGTSGMMIVILVSLLLEYASRFFGMPNGIYRLLFLRYSGASAIGIYMTWSGFKSRLTFLFLALLSSIYIYI